MTFPSAPPGYRPQPPPPLSPGGQPLADFGTRLLAYVIDSALVTAVVSVVAVPVFMVVLMNVVGDNAYLPTFGSFLDEVVRPLVLAELGLLLLVLVAYYVYYVEIMFRSGQTLGKKAMNIRVVPLDPAARLTRVMAAKRYAVEVLGGTLVPFFAWLDGLWQLGDKPYLQTLHDKAAQTVVIKVSQ